MPASIGLTHLRTKSLPKHSYEERLRALTLVDEEHRLALAAQWRNTHRPGSRGHGFSGVEQVEPPHHHHHRNIDFTLRSTTASTQRTDRQLPTGAPPLHSGGVPPQTSSSSFLSPPTTVVRGAMSYLENPQTARLDRNDYVMYFRSTVHDADVARALVATAPSSSKKKRMPTQSGHLAEGNDGGGVQHPPDHNSNGGMAMPVPVLRFGTLANSAGSGSSGSGGQQQQRSMMINPYSVAHQPEFDELKSTSTLQQHTSAGGGGMRNTTMSSPRGGAAAAVAMSASPSVSDAWAASLQETSMMSIPTILLNHQQRAEAGVLGMLGQSSPLWEADDDDLDDLDDDLGFSPSNSRKAAAAKRQQQQQTKAVKKRNAATKNASSAGSLISSVNQTGSLSFPAGGAPPGAKGTNSFRAELPMFEESNRHPLGGGGTLGKSSSGRGSATTGGSSSNNIAASQQQQPHQPQLAQRQQHSNGPLPDHVADRHRLKQYKPRYAAPAVDVTTLKPKCAALHVKLEKLSQRMKAEDNEFNEFLGGYLSKLRRV